MSPRRPYLLRAFYEWIVDNELTPFLVIDATRRGVQVPQEFVQDGQIILNVAPQSVGNFNITNNDVVTFNARFSGRPHSVILPMASIQAIYAKENGAGTVFEFEEVYESDKEEILSSVPSLDKLETGLDDDKPDSPDDSSRSSNNGRPTLRVIK